MSVVLTRSEKATAAVPQAGANSLVVNQSSIQVWPNPFENNLNVQFMLPKEEAVQISVHSSLGQLLYNSNQGRLQPGKHIVPLQLNFTAGTYVLSVTHDQTVSSTIIIKQ
jgi:hypothetical protein